MHVILRFAFTPIWKRLTQRAKSLRGGRCCQGGGRSGLKVWDQGGSHRRQTSHQIWSEKISSWLQRSEYVTWNCVPLFLWCVFKHCVACPHRGSSDMASRGQEGGSHIDYEARTAPTFPYIAMPGRLFIGHSYARQVCQYFPVQNISLLWAASYPNTHLVPWAFDSLPLVLSNAHRYVALMCYW